MTTIYVDPNAPGANNGLNWSDAYTDIQSFLDVMNPGDICLARNIQTLTSILLPTRNGTNVGRITIRGMNALGVNDGTYFTIDVNSAVANAISSASDYLDFENVHFTNSTSDLIGNAGGAKWHKFTNCKFSNSGNRAVQGIDNCLFKKCYFLNNTGTDINSCGDSIIQDCIGMNANRFVSASACSIIDSIIHDYSIGVYTNKTGVTISGTIIDTCSAAGFYDAGNNTNIVNSSITNSAVAFLVASGTAPSYGSTYFYNPGNTDIGGAGAAIAVDMGDNRLTGVNSSDRFADLVNHDFTITLGADGTNVEISIGGSGDSVNSAFSTQGIQPVGGAGGMLYQGDMNGGING